MPVWFIYLDDAMRTAPRQQRLNDALLSANASTLNATALQQDAAATYAPHGNLPVAARTRNRGNRHFFGRLAPFSAVVRSRTGSAAAAAFGAALRLVLLVCCAGSTRPQRCLSAFCGSMPSRHQLRFYSATFSSPPGTTAGSAYAIVRRHRLHGATLWLAWMGDERALRCRRLSACIIPACVSLLIAAALGTGGATPQRRTPLQQRRRGGRQATLPAFAYGSGLPRRRLLTTSVLRCLLVLPLGFAGLLQAARLKVLDSAWTVSSAGRRALRGISFSPSVLAYSRSLPRWRALYRTTWLSTAWFAGWFCRRVVDIHHAARATAAPYAPRPFRSAGLRLGLASLAMRRLAAVSALWRRWLRLPVRWLRYSLLFRKQRRPPARALYLPVASSPAWMPGCALCHTSHHHIPVLCRRLAATLVWTARGLTATRILPGRWTFTVSFAFSCAWLRRVYRVTAG